MPSPVLPLGTRTAPSFTSMSFCAWPRKSQRSAKTLGLVKSSSNTGTEKSIFAGFPSVVFLAAFFAAFGPAASGTDVALA